MTIHIYIDFPYEPVQHGEFFPASKMLDTIVQRKDQKREGYRQHCPAFQKRKQEGSCNTEHTPKFLAHIHQQ